MLLLQPSNLSSNKIFFSVLGIITFIMFIGFRINIMDIDAAQYAKMSMQMLETGNWLQFYDNDVPYLDKPPLVFWTAGLSYMLFGVNEIAFRIPSFIFTILAWWAVYQLCMLYYNEKTAKIATILLACCQASFLISHDCRTDTLLMGSVTMALYGLMYYIEKQKIKYYIIGIFFISLALLAKGPIGLMVPAFGFLAQIIFKNDWKQFWNPLHLLALVIIGIMLAPMCIGLYQQYGNKGLRFYFWTQSFGRITGESEWNNHAPVTFLFESLQWALIPWTLCLYPALWNRIKRIFFKNENIPEWFSFWAFIIPLIALSSSKYQLPHYIFVTLPLIAIFTADSIIKLSENKESIFKYLFNSQIVINVLLVLLGITLAIFCFTVPSFNYVIIFVGLVMIAIIVVLGLQRNIYTYVIGFAITGVGINFSLNSQFYPQLLQYQSFSKVGQYLEMHKISPENFTILNLGTSHSLNFYYKKTAKVASNLQEISRVKPQYIFTNDAGLDSIKAKKWEFKTIEKYKKFHVTGLTINFLNPKTRDTETENQYLILLEK